MRVFALRSVASMVSLLAVLVPVQAMVRDSVTIDIQGQKRTIRLVSDNARVVRREQCGANPTGVTLEGRFRLELVRPNGGVCGKLDLGDLSFDHGDGWDRKRALLLGDYNGDGHRWEVAFACDGGASNAAGRGLAGYDAKAGRLARYRFVRDGTPSDSVYVSRYPAALAWRDGRLRARYYTNAGDPGGWVADVYRWDTKKGGFVFTNTVKDAEPSPWPEWPSK